MSTIRSWMIGLAIGLAALVAGPQVLAQQSADEIAEAEAFALGYQAYITGAVYARSQILMEYDINPNAPLNAPLNAFNIYPELATPDTAIDFTPNNDTVYGLAWLDLRHGPVLMTIPVTPDRYWVVQATDLALNTLDYVGSRVGSKPGNYAYVPPGWTGTLPAGVTRMDNPSWQKLDFYPLLNRPWTFGGVREQDRGVAGLASALGIGPGLIFDPSKLNAAQRRGLERAAKTGF